MSGQPHIFKMVQKHGSTRRFGARYGRRVRDRLGSIEKTLRSNHQCPYCKAKSAKREAAGIWNCKKCGAKFSAKAYTAKTERVVEE